MGRGGGGLLLLLLMLEHSAARLNRVNCSGGQGVQHSSGTLCLHCVAERRGAGAQEWGGTRGTTRREGNHLPETLLSGNMCIDVCVCLYVYE